MDIFYKHTIRHTFIARFYKQISKCAACIEKNKKHVHKHSNVKNFLKGFGIVFEQVSVLFEGAKVISKSLTSDNVVIFRGKSVFWKF